MTFSKNRLNLITAHHINDHLHSINWLHNYRSMSRSGRWEGRGQEWGHDQGGKCGQLNHTSIIVGNFRSNPNPYTGGGRSRQSVKPSKPGGARQLANAKTADARLPEPGAGASSPAGRSSQTLAETEGKCPFHSVPRPRHHGHKTTRVRSPNPIHPAASGPSTCPHRYLHRPPPLPRATAHCTPPWRSPRCRCGPAKLLL